MFTEAEMKVVYESFGEDKTITYIKKEISEYVIPADDKQQLIHYVNEQNKRKYGKEKGEKFRENNPEYYKEYMKKYREFLKYKKSHHE